MTTTTFYDPASILLTIGKHSKARCAARGVLTVLASFARWSGEGAGTCYPSMTRIAELAGVTVRTVQRCIARLVALGEVEVVTKGTGRRNTLYRLSIFTRAKVSGQGRQKRPPITSESKYNPLPLRKRSRSRSRPAVARTAPPQDHAGEGSKVSGAGIAQRHAESAPVRPSAKWRALDAGQIADAMTKCAPARWVQLREDAARDGVTGDDLDAAAAWRWRAAAIMAGVL